MPWPTIQNTRFLHDGLSIEGERAQPVISRCCRQSLELCAGHCEEQAILVAATSRVCIRNRRRDVRPQQRKIDQGRWPRHARRPTRRNLTGHPFPFKQKTKITSQNQKKGMAMSTPQVARRRKCVRTHFRAVKMCTRRGPPAKMCTKMCTDFA